MPKDTREILSGLRKKGFVEKSGDHKYLHLVVRGKKTIIHTKISHGEREIGDNLLGLMARQVCLSRKDFLLLIDCPLSMDEYLDRLRHSGHIE